MSTRTHACNRFPLAVAVAAAIKGLLALSNLLPLAWLLGEEVFEALLSHNAANIQLIFFLIVELV